MFDAAREKAKADAIPRYQQPMYEEEHKVHDCWNCDHHVAIELDDKLYDLCVAERDITQSGEVYECDPEVTDCWDWVPDE